MAKALEDKLTWVGAADASAPEGREKLRRALGDRANLVVARAAKRIGKEKITELAAELPDVLMRLLAGGIPADKGCLAKLEVAQAIYELGMDRADAQDPLLAGARYAQEEPTFGGTVDTAAEFRGVCALGLVRIGYHDVMTVLADLLADPETQTRIMAARAIAYAGQESGALLLRLKALIGDAEVSVIAECFTALVQLSPAKSLPLLERFLNRANADIAQDAAIAIACSKHDQAMDILRRHWEQDITLRESLVVPLAMLRRNEAVEMLLGAIERGSEALAIAAVEAMGMYRSDTAVRERVLKLATAHSPAVHRAAAKSMGA